MTYPAIREDKAQLEYMVYWALDSDEASVPPRRTEAAGCIWFVCFLVDILEWSCMWVVAHERIEDTPLFNH
jgi:hypothetical protein